MNEVSANSSGSQKRAAKILETAAGVFAREGFAQADVQQIADAAGVGKGTIYRHFGSKEGLFLAVARHARNEVHDEADAQANSASSPLDRLRRGLTAFVNYFYRHPEVVELLIQERANFRDKMPTFFDDSDHRNDHWIHLFEQLVTDGTLRAIPISQIRAALSRFVFGAMFVIYLGGPDTTEPEDAMIEILLNGLLVRTIEGDKQV